MRQPVGEPAAPAEREHATGREPAQRQREHVDHRQAEEEVRNRDAQERRPDHAVVGERVPPPGRVDPDRDGDQVGDDERRTHQQESRADPVGDQLGDRLAVLERDPEVALEQPAEPVQVLGEHRLVEPEFGLGPGDVLGGRGRREEQVGRTARGQVDDEEVDHGDPEQDRYADQQPADQVGDHQPATAFAAVVSMDSGKWQAT
jgi:hypothetical protein